VSDRYGPPRSDDPKRFAGLTARRREKGLPVGRTDEGATDFLARVEARAKELYALSNQGDWDDLAPWMKESWINAAGRELRGEE
jgi:hypothetical protein